MGGCGVLWGLHFISPLSTKGRSEKVPQDSTKMKGALLGDVTCQKAIDLTLAGWGDEGGGNQFGPPLASGRGRPHTKLSENK